MWGKGVRYPKTGQTVIEKSLLSLKKSSSGLIKTHQPSPFGLRPGKPVFFHQAVARPAGLVLK